MTLQQVKDLITQECDSWKKECRLETLMVLYPKADLELISQAVTELVRQGVLRIEIVPRLGIPATITLRRVPYNL